MELSKRLQAVANLVGHVDSMADVGTDHGYIPIYLIESNKCKKALAMDVNKGPLLRAQEHIAEHQLDENIETRLSDGVKQLGETEVECVVIAGMGGALTVRIMEDGESVFRNLKEFVLQPQSELVKVRTYLAEQEYQIVSEDMVFEDGKYYPMMKVVNGRCEDYHPVELQYGKLLLKQKHPVLYDFLRKEKDKKQMILTILDKEGGSHIEIRKKEIEQELEGIEYALQRYYECD